MRMASHQREQVTGTDSMHVEQVLKILCRCTCFHQHVETCVKHVGDIVSTGARIRFAGMTCQRVAATLEGRSVWTQPIDTYMQNAVGMANTFL